jgi:cephalosporin-C deacetylase-like acetyl esterase
MKCRLLVAFSVVLASFSGRSVAAPADPERMLAAPTAMFTEWQTRFALPRPDFQALRTFAGLPPLLEFYDGRPVRTADQWLERKAELRRLLCEYFLGTPPRQAPKCQRTRILAQRREGASVSRLVELTFGTTPEVSISVEILLPDGPGPFPVLFTQTNHRRWGLIALARGYMVCVYPGADIDDQSDKFLAVYPQCDWARLLRRAWTASRALDYVLTLPEVDRQHVAITGHSRNGKQSLIAAAMDERFTAVISSSSGVGGAVAYRFGSERAFDESVEFMTRNRTTGTWFSQRLRWFVGRENKLPTDNHALLGLIAPRHCLISTAYNDGCDQSFSAEQSYLAAREVYRFLGHPEALRIAWRPGGHETCAEVIERYLDWCDFAFGRSRAGLPEELIHHFDWDAWHRQAPAAAPPRDAEVRRRIAWGLGEEPPRQAAAGGTYGRAAAHVSAMLDRGLDGDKVGCVAVNFGEYVAGDLYFPKAVKGPLPVVVWLHPYSYNLGYNGAYMVGPRLQQFLPQKGVAVLAFDQIGFGSRLHEAQRFYDRYPRWSRLGKMVRDVRAAVDLLTLAGRPEGVGRPADMLKDMPPIDAKRIYLLGYALGGTVALHAAALDSRVAGVACFAGFTPMRTDTAAKPTGGLRRFWQWHALEPQLGLFQGRESELPYDFDDLFRLVAPRPCLVVAPRHDRDADPADVDRMIAAVRAAWNAGGAPANLTYQTPDDYSRFQGEQQEAFWKWLQPAVPGRK